MKVYRWSVFPASVDCCVVYFWNKSFIVNTHNDCITDLTLPLYIQWHFNFFLSKKDMFSVQKYCEFVYWVYMVGIAWKWCSFKSLSAESSAQLTLSFQLKSSTSYFISFFLLKHFWSTSKLKVLHKWQFFSSYLFYLKSVMRQAAGKQESCDFFSIIQWQLLSSFSVTI